MHRQTVGNGSFMNRNEIQLRIFGL
jgi:hypothetical protein